jgi:hypothetical protein
MKIPRSVSALDAIKVASFTSGKKREELSYPPSKRIPARLPFQAAINLRWISVFWYEFVSLFNRVRKLKIWFRVGFSD